MNLELLEEWPNWRITINLLEKSVSFALVTTSMALENSHVDIFFVLTVSYNGGETIQTVPFVVKRSFWSQKITVLLSDSKIFHRLKKMKRTKNSFLIANSAGVRLSHLNRWTFAPFAEESIGTDDVFRSVTQNGTVSNARVLKRLKMMSYDEIKELNIIEYL